MPSVYLCDWKKKKSPLSGPYLLFLLLSALSLVGVHAESDAAGLQRPLYERNVGVRGTAAGESPRLCCAHLCGLVPALILILLHQIHHVDGPTPGQFAEQGTVTRARFNVLGVSCETRWATCQDDGWLGTLGGLETRVPLVVWHQQKGQELGHGPEGFGGFYVKARWLPDTGAGCHCVWHAKFFGSCAWLKSVHIRISDPTGEERAQWKLAWRSTSDWNAQAGLTEGKTSSCSSVSKSVVALSDKFFGVCQPKESRAACDCPCHFALVRCAASVVCAAAQPKESAGAGRGGSILIICICIYNIYALV